VLAVKTWRLLDPGVRSASEHMALDEAVLKARAKDRVPNTVRFLQFSPDCVLVGWHQSVAEEVRLEYCRNEGIDINRRITGGGAILFDRPQLGWELIASKDDLNLSVATKELFEWICQAAINGLKTLGVTASFRPRNDIEIEGRKISGTGGTEEGSAFLFQGTLLIDFDADKMIKSLRIPTEKLKDKELESVKERVTCLREQLGVVPDISTIKGAIAFGFERAFNVKLEASPLTLYEKMLLEKKLPKFSSHAWIYGMRTSLSDDDTVRAAHKGDGGLIRASLKLNSKRKRITSALITGDFFAFPKRAIFDLEAKLKDSAADVRTVTDKVFRFFEDSKPDIPGLSPSDFADVLVKALDKLGFSKYGLSLTQANSITTVCSKFDDLLQKEIQYLLLPYCSKLPECEFRYQKACTECSKCTCGDGYKLAGQYGMEAITIINFEDLIETLEGLKRAGEEAFVGCCCEPFYIKHAEDFEKVGLPGILIDIDNNTCYDLGKERDAYFGRFENQTHLQLDLLEKVLSILNKSSHMVKIADGSTN
jgi:lipoate-protein ligase A